MIVDQRWCLDELSAALTPLLRKALNFPRREFECKVGKVLEYRSFSFWSYRDGLGTPDSSSFCSTVPYSWPSLRAAGVVGLAAARYRQHARSASRLHLSSLFFMNGPPALKALGKLPMDPGSQANLDSPGRLLCPGLYVDSYLLPCWLGLADRCTLARSSNSN